MILRYFVALLVLFSCQANAEGNLSLPNSSILGVEGSGKNGIEFECHRSAIDKNLITCDFIQVFVSNKLNIKELPEKNRLGIAEAIEELKKEGYQSLINEGVCEILNESNISDLSSVGTDYMREFISLLKDSCPVNELKGATDLITEFVLMKNKYDSVTCSVFLNKWSSEFKYQPSGEYWASSRGPSGTCGVVYISTLKSPTSYLWEYTTKKVVTNKAATGGLMPCDQLDEEEQVYSWKAESRPLSCEYIDF